MLRLNECGSARRPDVRVHVQAGWSYRPAATPIPVVTNGPLPQRVDSFHAVRAHANAPLLMEGRMDPRKYATLLAVVQESAAGRDGNARALLDRPIGDHLEAGARAEDLHFYLFARALTKRLASGMGEEINLYLRQFQETQISLFNL